MRVISVKTLKEYGEKHADVYQSLLAWYAEAEKAHWGSPHEILNRYPRASILENNRVVFRIKGNHYRLIAAISYVHHIVRIKFVGTHKEYDQIDGSTINNY